MELKHASAYLHYYVSFYVDMYEFTNGNSNPELRKFTLDVDNLKLCLGYGKLALRPLSDLTKEIEHKGEKFVPIDNFMYKTSVEDFTEFPEQQHNLIHGLKYADVKLLLEWHFDIFGLIPQGKAIDINTINK